MMNRIRDLRQVICFINCQNQGASRSIAQWAPIRAFALDPREPYCLRPLAKLYIISKPDMSLSCKPTIYIWKNSTEIADSAHLVFAKYIIFGLVILTRLCDWDAVFDWSQNLYSDFRIGNIFVYINIPTESKMQIRILLQYTH